MRLNNLFEDLDDKDEFVTDYCDICDDVRNTVALRQISIDPDQFHVAHIESGRIADEAETETETDRRFDKEMSKRGYRKDQRGIWVNKSEKEPPHVKHIKRGDRVQYKGKLGTVVALGPAHGASVQIDNELGMRAVNGNDVRKITY